MNTKKCNILIFRLGICFLFFALSSFFIYMYPLRELIIKFGELLLSRPLTHEPWHERFIDWQFYFFIWFLIFSITCILFATYNFVNSITELNIHFFYAKKKWCAFYKANRKFFFSLLFIFLSLSILRFYYADKKVSFHEDECWELGMVNDNKHGFKSSFDYGIPYTGKDIKELALFDDASLTDTAKDILTLLTKKRYSDHGRLFYVLYRLWFTGYASSDIRAINQRGIKLNFIFFCFSFYFMSLLVYKMSKNKFLTCCLPVIIFANPISIGIFILFRAYEIQELCFILFTYLAFHFYTFIEQDIDNIGTVPNYVAGVLITALILSADYFPILYVCIIGFVLLLCCIKKQQYKNVCFLILLFFSSLVLCKITFIHYADAILWYVKHPVGYDGMNNISLKMLFCFVFFLIFVTVLFFKLKRISFQSIVFVSALLWIVIVHTMTARNQIRYVAAAFALLPLVLAFNVTTFNIKLKSFLFSFVCLIMCCGLYFGLPTRDNIKRVNNYFIKTKNYDYPSLEFLKDSYVPVVILDNWYRIKLLYPYLNNEQVYYFVKSTDDIAGITINSSMYWLVWDVEESGIHEKLCYVESD